MAFHIISIIRAKSIYLHLERERLKWRWQPIQVAESGMGHRWASVTIHTSKYSSDTADPVSSRTPLLGATFKCTRMSCLYCRGSKWEGVLSPTCLPSASVQLTVLSAHPGPSTSHPHHAHITLVLAFWYFNKYIR